MGGRKDCRFRRILVRLKVFLHVRFGIACLASGPGLSRCVVEFKFAPPAEEEETQAIASLHHLVNFISASSDRSLPVSIFACSPTRRDFNYAATAVGPGDLPGEAKVSQGATSRALLHNSVTVPDMVTWVMQVGHSMTLSRRMARRQRNFCTSLPRCLKLLSLLQPSER